MNGATAASTMKNAPAHRVASPPHRIRFGDAMRAFLLLPALLSRLARLAELDEDIQYHRDQPRDRRGADHADGGLRALRAKAEDYDGREEGGHPAADVFPADTYYRGVNVEAHRTGGVEQEVPGDPAQERRDTRYREAPSRAGPRPGGEGGGGEHPGHDGGNVGYRYSVHERSSISRLERLRDTKYSARSVLGSHRDVGLICLKFQSSLETLARRRSHGLQLVWDATDEHLPASDLRGAILTDVERYFAFGSYLSDDSGRLFGVPLPRKAKSPVGL